MQVGIVGAGLAGLASAWMLDRAGVDVTVFEARDRVGGRCFSHRFDNGAVVERGGEFVDADQHVIRRFCADLGLPLLPHGVTFLRRRAGLDRRPSVAELVETMEKVARFTREELSRPEDDRSVDDVFAEVLGGSYADSSVYQRFVTSIAAEPNVLSARFYLWDADAETLDVGSRVLGGNQQIALKMAEALGPKVQLGRPVTAVEPSASHVDLTFEDGGSQRVDVLVLALPLPLLKALTWPSGMPQDWHRAIGQLGFSEAAKLSVTLKTPAAPLGVQSPDARWWSWNSQDQYGELSVGAVTAFAGGPGTVRDLELADAGQRWAKEMAALRPDLDLQLEERLVTNWPQERFTQGSYSHALVGWDESVDPLLRTTQGRVMLAGEHTVGRLGSSLNGALASGVRCATAVGQEFG